MTEPLSYASPNQTARRWSERGVAALLLGLASGPITFVLLWGLALASPVSGRSGGSPALALLAFFLMPVVTFAYSLTSIQHMSESRETERGRGLAVGGLLAALAWPVAFFMFVILSGSMC